MSEELVADGSSLFFNKGVFKAKLSLPCRLTVFNALTKQLHTEKLKRTKQ